MDEAATDCTKASSSNPIHAILTAARFAAEKHASQRRKGAAAEPYINHLLEVAELVSSVQPVNTNLIIAALLHDTVEDAGVSKEEVIQMFGGDVADLVMEVTDDKSLTKAERKHLQIVHAPQLSVRAQVIKLADKISNLRGIIISQPADWSDQRKREYFGWAKKVVDGLSEPNPVLKTEFERVYEWVGNLGAL